MCGVGPGKAKIFVVSNSIQSRIRAMTKNKRRESSTYCVFFPNEVGRNFHREGKKSQKDEFSFFLFYLSFRVNSVKDSALDLKLFDAPDGRSLDETSEATAFR